MLVVVPRDRLAIMGETLQVMKVWCWCWCLWLKGGDGQAAKDENPRVKRALLALARAQSAWFEVVVW